MVIRKAGAGLSFAFCTDWTPGWGVEFEKWEYYPDFTVYSIYYTLGRKVPQDIGLMHLLRTDLVTYSTEREVLLSLINFVEKVGANVGSLEREIVEADHLRGAVDQLYVEQDYEGCVKKLTEAREALSKISKDTMKVKARALMWIWTVEWMVVTATLMITGFATWTLMVRRRLYRHVGATRYV